MLFFASFLALYFELVIIRYLSAEIRVFAYLKNLPLIASFLGIGLGMILGKPPRILGRAFPLIAAALFFLIAYASSLNLTHLRMPSKDYFVWTTWDSGLTGLGAVWRYFGTVFGVLGLVVAFFVVLGGLVGQHFSRLSPLRGYGVNLAGSLAGIVAFTMFSFYAQPPAVWILVGFLVALPFFFRKPLAIFVFALIISAIAAPEPNTFWSPYYRINFFRILSPAGWPHPSAYVLNVNYDYHQKVLDLSPGFIARYPNAEPNHSAFSTYELPYRLVPNPGDVLIVGAGTGNDVAAALRHGAAHIDAVEIDPLILKLGRQYHPEQPYDSPRVSLYIDDARAFFKKVRKPYDLIIFGYLDAQTLLSGYSSLRLDNYVYTLESLREAKSLLKEGGSVVLAFASGESFVTDRLFATLDRAFETPPRVYYTGYDGAGVVFVEGGARNAPPLTEFRDISKEVQSREDMRLIPTDHWPFLYLRGRKVPVSMLWVLMVFLYGSYMTLRRTLKLRSLANREYLHLFLLGAGFLLLETKGVTELSLLFGSTWIVNALVIGSFLTMGLLANTLVMFRPIRRSIAYVALFFFLGVGMVFPYARLDALPATAKVLSAGILVGLPVFFSSLVFSRCFRDVARPSEALGINLFGAVIGGALENAVMVGGTPILGYLGILLYAFSAILARR